MSEKTLPHKHSAAAVRISGRLPSPEEFRVPAEVFKCLADGSRLRIFWLLCHCEECVTNISALVEMSSPAVSHHLRTLRTQGLLQSRREGKEVYYKAADTELAHWLHHVVGSAVELGNK